MSNGIGFGPMTDLDTPDKRKSVGNADPRLTRTNYFDGRLLTARDLIRDQHYLDDRVREVGRAIGSGIAHGLGIELSDSGVLTVHPGLAVSTSGRVLELAHKTLNINLYDQALLSELNEGKSQVLDNGLYAVALQYLEVGTDSAEVYPQDLASARTFHFNTYTEGVEVVLVPLRTPLPQTNKVQGQQRLSGFRGLGARAALVPELIYRDGQPPELSGDAVALALLAIRDQRPLWLDLGLVRRPLRPALAPLRLQQDLHGHFRELFDDVSTVRSKLGLRQDYPADLYFRQLPPHGPLPKDGLSPVDGAQGFFPAHISVSIAPVREGDLPTLIAESANLDPIDLDSDEPAEVMVVVPLSDADFAFRARQLQHQPKDEYPQGHSQLWHIDPLALRLRGRQPVHSIDTDASAWQDIWSKITEVYYLRRPPRVTETQVSAIVLASGYQAPEGAVVSETDTNKLKAELIEKQKDLEKAMAEAADAKARAKAAEEAATTDTAGEAELRDKLSKAEAKAEKLGIDLADAREKAAAASDLEKERATLDKDLKDAKARIEILETSAEAGSEVPALEARIKELQGEVVLKDEALAKAKEAATPARDVEHAIALRKIKDPETVAAADELTAIAKRDPKTAAAVNDALVLVDRRYNDVLVRTLAAAAKAGEAEAFATFLAKQDPAKPLGTAVAKAGDKFGLDPELTADWRALEA